MFKSHKVHTISLEVQHRSKLQPLKACLNWRPFKFHSRNVKSKPCNILSQRPSFLTGQSLRITSPCVAQIVQVNSVANATHKEFPVSSQRGIKTRSCRRAIVTSVTSTGRATQATDSTHARQAGVWRCTWTLSNNHLKLLFQAPSHCCNHPDITALVDWA